jgi:hypothetical protein
MDTMTQSMQGVSSDYDELAGGDVPRTEADCAAAGPDGVQQHARGRGLLVYTLGFLALVFTIVAVAGPILVLDMFNEAMDSRSLITNARSKGFPGWQDSQNESHRQVHMYVFQVDNPDGFVLRGEKPQMSEHGPFVYRQRMRKINITFPPPDSSISDDLLSYRLWTTFEFDSNATRVLSNGTYDSDTDVMFTVVDLLFWGEQATAGTALWRFLNSAKNDTERMFARLTARQIKDGYGACPICFPGLLPNQPTVKDTDPRPMTVRVGTSDRSQVQQIVKWHGMRQLETLCPWRKTASGAPFCPGGRFDNGSGTANSSIGRDSGACCDERGTNVKVPLWRWPVPGFHAAEPPPQDLDTTFPNTVGGTSGDQFRRHPGKSVSVFADVLHRHIVLHRTAQHSLDYVPGIELSRYEIPAHDPGSNNASTEAYNGAYYMNGARGLQNATVYKNGAPVYITKPHFYDTGPEVSGRVEGLSPNSRKHQTFLCVEPHSGKTFYSRQRIQVNVQVKTVKFASTGKEYEAESGGKNAGLKEDDDDSTWFAGLPDGATYVPMAWFDERGEINEDAATMFKNGLQLVHNLYFGALVGGGGLALTFLVATLVLVSGRRS